MPMFFLSLLACDHPSDTDTPFVVPDEWPGYAAAGDAVYIQYDGVPNLVRATPGGVERLDLEGRVPLWAEASPDGRFLLVLTESEAGVEHVLVKDGKVVLAFPDQDTNQMAMSPDGRHLALWYDSAYDPHTDLMVDVGKVTLVDTEALVATQITTGLAPKTVALGNEVGMVVGPGGAVGLDLLGQAAGETYDFAAEGVAGEGWGYWGVVSPDETYGFVSAKIDTEDDTVVRVGLTTRSILTAEAPLGIHDGDYVQEAAPQLFRVGDVLFAHTDRVGLAWIKPDAFAFTMVETGVHFQYLEVLPEVGVLYGREGTYTLRPDPITLELDPSESGQNSIWFGENEAVVSHYQGGTWHAEVLDFATGDNWMVPLQDILGTVAVMPVDGVPTALLEIRGVDTYGLLPLSEESGVASIGTHRSRFGAMANDEAFYLIGDDVAEGFIGFLDPVTGEQTEYRDFTDLGLMEEP